MEQQNWIDVPEHQQEHWGWLEYRATVKCVCGQTIEIWDGDIIEEDDEYFTCECGRIYSVRLVYQDRK